MSELSSIVQDVESIRPLSSREIREETRVAQAIVNWCLERVGMQVSVSLEFNGRFTSRMGDARVTSIAPPKGRVRLSSSPLWRRASPEKRRNTVIHEVAHVLAQVLAGPTVKVGHGRGWKQMMLRLGENPQRCHTVNRDGLRRGKYRDAITGQIRSERAVVEPSGVQALFCAGLGKPVLLVEILRRNERTATVRLLEDWGHRPEGWEMRVPFENVLLDN